MIVAVIAIIYVFYNNDNPQDTFKNPNFNNEVQTSGKPAVEQQSQVPATNNSQPQQADDFSDIDNELNSLETEINSPQDLSPNDISDL